MPPTNMTNLYGVIFAGKISDRARVEPRKVPIVPSAHIEPRMRRAFVRSNQIRLVRFSPGQLCVYCSNYL